MVPKTPGDRMGVRCMFERGSQEVLWELWGGKTEE